MHPLRTQSKFPTGHGMTRDSFSSFFKSLPSMHIVIYPLNCLLSTAQFRSHLFVLDSKLQRCTYTQFQNGCNYRLDLVIRSPLRQLQKMLQQHKRLILDPTWTFRKFSEFSLQKNILTSFKICVYFFFQITKIMYFHYRKFENRLLTIAMHL